MKRLINWLNKNFESTILILAMAYFVFATFFQVLARFVFKISAPWTEETSRYIFIWMTFIGSSYAASKSQHISVDLLESKLSKKQGFVLRMVIMTIFLIFALIIFYSGLNICITLTKKAQVSPVLKIPMIYVYSALPVVMFLTSLRIIQNIVRDYNTYKKEAIS